ncbi:DNA topoisomerase III [Thalassotalea ponticola]|uniref:DNA topoisomerase III n=1 Tax=Thalassotalea ponticola TaxID=1523392 RepID=UPI0025B44574|nr:DNA topoisomerase III [Thalassotalea ponticola]MDN3651994.1 DNA topoisomerase III [Thalassotalea ponticola]
MKLYIAEKPSLARAVAAVMSKPQQKGDGFIKVANGDIVTWCIGHLLEQAEPDAYDPAFKKWSTEHLPIIPSDWKLVVKSKTRKQFNVVKKLIKQADILVNLGDPDREGQILIDQMFNYCGASEQQKKSALRCLVSDLNPSAVTRALNNLKPNSDFLSLSVSALARARADWLYGMNMTRMCTLQGQKSGYQGVLSIGRVQTPVLGLVVHRDLAIENFVSTPFYEVIATLKTAKGEIYKGKWKPSESCKPYMDDEDRVISRPLAENVVNRIANKRGNIADFIKKTSKKSAPLPHSLSSLQIEAAKVFGYSAQKVLDTCQALYERHKLITYPRSDCRYLPKEHLSEAGKVLQAIASIDKKLANFTDDADVSRKSSAWNDSKVGAHHAIIPTTKKIDSAKLSNDELNIYYLVARHYLIQFYPPSEYADKQIKTIIEGGLFISKQRDLTYVGWQALFNKQESQTRQAEDTLPDVAINDPIQCVAGTIEDKNTTPPKRFTDATLLAAMTGIARYVTSADIKKILKDTDGIGTEATRASIIELLFKRQYLSRKGKEIIATEIGRSVILALPESVGEPDMTAIWEAQLEAIYQKQRKYGDFMNDVTENLNRLLYDTGNANFSSLKGKGKMKARRNYKKQRSSTTRSSSTASRRTKGSFS